MGNSDDEPMTVYRWATVAGLDPAAGSGWGGLWAVLFTAQRGIEALIQVSSFSDGLDLIFLAEELRGDCDDIANRHPEDVANAVTVDLGPLPGPDMAPVARDLAGGLVSAGTCRVLDLLNEPQPHDESWWLAGLIVRLYAVMAELNGTVVR